MSLDPRQLRYKPWILMYALSILSLMACFLIVYLITKTRDVSFEWMGEYSGNTNDCWRILHRAKGESQRV
ncbi:hypothetical protein KEJ21_04035 [Candidatus Bathyarchaeota archaeon]|nr:hypothetical protein [Candidatus Bathyarchaeota archaeon]